MSAARLVAAGEEAHGPALRSGDHELGGGRPAGHGSHHQGKAAQRHGGGRWRTCLHIAAPPGAVSKEADRRCARYRARMDLIETLRSTGAVRDFLPDPIDDAVLYRVLDTHASRPAGAIGKGGG